MKIACIVLGTVAVVLGIAIVIVLLCDRKNNKPKADIEDGEGQPDDGKLSIRK